MARDRMTVENAEVETLRLAISSGIEERIRFISQSKTAVERAKWRAQFDAMTELYGTFGDYLGRGKSASTRITAWNSMAIDAAAEGAKLA